MITSTKNQRIIDLRKLTQRKHRRRQNRFWVEGLQLLTMAVEAAARQPHKIIPGDVFYSEALFSGETAPQVLDRLTQAGATAIPVAPEVLDSLSDRDTSQGLIATFALNELEWTFDELGSILSPTFGRAEGKPSISNLQPFDSAQDKSPNLPISNLSSPALILLLDQLQDPGNLGTLIRTADAVGVAAIILLEPCVDPFDPKTVRGSMGSLFNVPFCRTTEAAAVLTQLVEWGYRPVGADAAQGRSSWISDVLVGPVALVLGNEARGLSDDLRGVLSDFVGLPLRGGAESLNVAVAGGVLLYEWLRVNDPMSKT